MDVPDRGIQLYLLLVAVVSAVAAVRGTNRFILDNTTAGTGWAVVVGAAVLLVVIELVVRFLRSSTDEDPLAETIRGERSPIEPAL